MPLLASVTDCMGCSACANICPHDAISMPWNAEGFHMPIVDLDLCTHCGACTKICPPLNQEHPLNQEQLQTPDIYGGWHLNDDIRLSSSSGGIFTALAEQIINEGGCVFGAAQNEDLSLSHVCIETKGGLARLRGSKYFQSDIGNTFRLVRKMLKTKRPVLFSGTPCQIAGLLSYMRKPHPLLITCDLACHGTPSYQLFRSYADYYTNEASSQLVGIDFRNKEYGWLQYTIGRYFQSGKSTSTNHGEDLFMRGFLSDICLGKACYGCPWNRFPRQADITLADYWGVQAVHPEWQTEKGISLLFANTENGRLWIDKIKNNLYLFRESMESIPDGSKWNQGLSQLPISMPKRRERFMQDLSNMNLSTVIDKHTFMRRAKFDVGIVGMWMTCNYGALLTTFALYRVLEDMELDPVLIDHSPIINVARFSETDNLFRHFIRDCGMKTTQPIDYGHTLTGLNDNIDTFLVGSDQVWRHQYTSSCGYYYFLDFVRGDKRKIAFGSSFGSEYDTAPEEFRSMASCCLQRFDAVAVRETNAIDILKNRYGIEADVVLDPVFLCKKKLYLDLIARSTKEITGEFILSYILDPAPNKREMLQHVAGQNRLKLINMLDAQFDFEEKKTQLNLENTIENLTIEDWLFYISKCNLLITDSFHGACFAIIFNKPFICISNRERGYPRFTSLLEKTGLLNHLIDPNDSLEKLQTIPIAIDYEPINVILQSEKQQSCKWLRHALEKPKQESKIGFHSILDQIVRFNETIKQQQNVSQHQVQELHSHITSMQQQIEQLRLHEQEHFKLAQEEHQAEQEHYRIIQEQWAVNCTHNHQLQEQLSEAERWSIKLHQYSSYKRRYYYCKILSKVTWGKKRIHYKQHKRRYKTILRSIRQYASSIIQR